MSAQTNNMPASLDETRMFYALKLYVSSDTHPMDDRTLESIIGCMRIDGLSTRPVPCGILASSLQQQGQLNAVIDDAVHWQTKARDAFDWWCRINISTIQRLVLVHSTSCYADVWPSCRLRAQGQMAEHL